MTAAELSALSDEDLSALASAVRREQRRREDELHNLDFAAAFEAHPELLAELPREEVLTASFIARFRERGFSIRTLAGPLRMSKSALHRWLPYYEAIAEALARPGAGQYLPPELSKYATADDAAVPSGTEAFR